MVIKRVQSVSLWDKDAVSTVLAGAKLAPGSAEFQEVMSQTSSSPSKEHCSIGLPMFVPSQPNLPTSFDGLRCSMCGAALTSREQQVEHYRSPWHLHNLRRSTQGHSPISLEQFEAQDEKDGSDSPGCDDEEEESTEDDSTDDSTDDEESDSHVLGRQPRLFFLNADGIVFSVYRNILFSKRVEIDGELDAVQRLQATPRRQCWAIFLLSGGHFAAAIFSGNKVEVRKTFHNYTVRAKQGGSQAGRDSQSGTSHPRSSGASLRRYNELSQRQHVQELLEAWRPKLDTCDLIFCHTKHHGRPTLFGGRRPILDPHDDRIRGIPFSTRRPKFAEVQRVHVALSEIFIHGTEEEFQGMVRESQEAEKKPKPKPKEPSPKKSPTKLKLKSERKKEVEKEVEEEETEDEGDGEMELVLRLRTISTNELGGGPDCCMGKRDKWRKKNKKVPGEGMDVQWEQRNKEDNSPVNQMSNKGLDATTVKQEESLESLEGENGRNKREVGRSRPKKKSKKSGKSDGKAKECPHKLRVWDVLQSACKSGNVHHLAMVLKRSPPADQDDTQGKELSAEVLTSIALVEIPEELSEARFGEKKRTMLHIAAESGQTDVVWWLLCEGCDAAAGDITDRMAYEDAADKNTRNVFRRFMSQQPQRYDYAKAKIPSPLTQALEEEQAAKLAVRRKAQRVAKAERQKEKKRKEKEEEERKKEAVREEEEKRRFLLLSDREKRALAAEKRFLQTQSVSVSSPSSLARCFQCAKDISGIVPFEYSDNRFCSTSCVREHRTKPKS